MPIDYKKTQKELYQPKTTPFIIYVPEIAKSNIYQATKYKTLSAKGVTFNCTAKSGAVKNI